MQRQAQSNISHYRKLRAQMAYSETSINSMLFADPALDSGDKPSGRVLIFNSGSLSGAKAWAAQDPHAKASLIKNKINRPHE